jgi:hypothetical protein
MMLFGLVGFTSTQGSTSLFRKFVPGPIAEMSQPANGLGPDTTFSGPTVIGPALVGPAVSTANMLARASTWMGVRGRIGTSSVHARSRHFL